MHQLSDVWLAHQRRRFTQHDAQRWWRCDAERWQRFDPRFQRRRAQIDGEVWAELALDESDREWRLALHRAEQKLAELRYEWALLRDELLGKSWEDQPRVPPGSPEGGQWTDSEGQNEPQILSDATPDQIKPGDQLAQRQPPRAPTFGPTPAQNARLAVTRMRADAAVRRVQEIDPNWRPTETSLTAPNDVEGYIARAEANAEEAEARLRELAQLPRGRLLEIYREQNSSPDRPWSREKNVVAVCTADQQLYFGVNPSAPTRTEADALRQQRAFESMINESPTVLRRGSIDWWPNYALTHAESDILLRMAEANRGTLTGRILDITVDRAMCPACEKVLPSLGVHLGNPRVSWYDDFGLQGIMHFRNWDYLRKR